MPQQRLNGTYPGHLATAVQVKVAVKCGKFRTPSKLPCTDLRCIIQQIYLGFRLRHRPCHLSRRHSPIPCN
ncbi:hypothetical protein DPMN_109747 [Dreissena polymorpha]|uniref:Uncharacterized protein n=1 Tax=Dreissena polymorpha TaxID=45954 RepID=A0A9D4KAU0_DREPO|nr:hypothetical protein DPMN_109747 [Dreissena polymorpha]